MHVSSERFKAIELHMDVLLRPFIPVVDYTVTGEIVMHYDRPCFRQNKSGLVDFMCYDCPKYRQPAIKVFEQYYNCVFYLK